MSTPPTLAVEATGLVKSFGDTRAVDGVDLAVRRGVVYGVLGPNGAGKTTTIRILATLLRPDAGTARALGHDVVADAGAVRAAVSLTGQLASVDQDLTGRENLILLGRLLGLRRPAAKERAGELLEAFRLAADGAKLVKHYAQRGAQRGVHGHFPADVPLQRLRRAEDPPPPARGVRERQSHLDPRHGISRPHGRPRLHRRHHRGPGVAAGLTAVFAPLTVRLYRRS